MTWDERGQQPRGWPGALGALSCRWPVPTVNVCNGPPLAACARLLSRERGDSARVPSICTGGVSGSGGGRQGLGIKHPWPSRATPQLKVRRPEGEEEAGDGSPTGRAAGSSWNFGAEQATFHQVDGAQRDPGSTTW